MKRMGKSIHWIPCLADVLKRLVSIPAGRWLILSCLTTVSLALSIAGQMSYPAVAAHLLDSRESFFPILLQTWPIPQPGRLLISEVVYDPVGAEPGGEWIEIYNAGGSPLDLGSYKIGDEEISGGQEGMLQFPAGARIEPGQVVIIASQAVVFFEHYAVKPDFEMRDSDPQTPELLKYTAWAGGNIELGNSGDEVLALDGADQLVDAVSWGASEIELKPPASRVPEGHSLERYPAGVDTDSAADWRDRPEPSPGRVELIQPTPSPTPPGPDSTPTPFPSLLFNEILADPDGDANRDGVADRYQDEFIEIVNGSDTAIDLSGWKLQDAVTDRHIFPEGSLAPVGCAVVVFSGGAPNGDFGGSLVQTASSKSLGLNNDGDTLRLVDLSATAVISYTFGKEAGDNQSITRDPDLTGPEPFVKHGLASGSAGALFSPGTKIDGSPFSGCAVP
jgi:hypothetical protein